MFARCVRVSILSEKRARDSQCSKRAATHLGIARMLPRGIVTGHSALIKSGKIIIGRTNSPAAEKRRTDIELHPRTRHDRPGSRHCKQPTSFEENLPWYLHARFEMLRCDVLVRRRSFISSIKGAKAFIDQNLLRHGAPRTFCSTHARHSKVLASIQIFKHV